MPSHEKFDYHYFERGIEERVSLYENFRWMPEVSFPIANYLKQKYKNEIILDYGCAKGFLVHALRLLNVESYGYDISKYALKNCHPEVKQFLFNDKKKIPKSSVIFIKDVLEHFEYEIVADELGWMCYNCNKMLAIIPLGENNKYRIPEYGFDKTHIIAENEEWWINKFNQAGFIVDGFYYKLDEIKSNWYNHNQFGNAFIFLKKGN